MKRLIAFLFALTLSTHAEAHGRLVNSIPPAGAITESPQTISLRFNEKIEEKYSGFELVDATGTKLDVQASVSGGGLMMTTALPQTLPMGTYTVNWHVVTVSDGHRTQGTLSFTVN